MAEPSGGSSVVELHFPKVAAAGSIPVPRSIVRCRCARTLPTRHSRALERLANK